MSGAYYNEFDPFAVQWLRNLIAAGHIPDGEVDERSITEVQSDDIKGFRQAHWFAGIGGWPFALRLAGWPDDREVWTGSCPCQPLSSAGQRKGHADERHLWPAFHRLIAERCPATILGEQVSGPLGFEWFAGVRADLEAGGYACGAADLPAACVGAPHIRQRLFWLAHANSTGSQPGRQAGAALGYGRPAITACADGGMAHCDGRITGDEREQRGGQQRFQPEDGSPRDWLGNTESERRQRWANDEDEGRRERAPGHSGSGGGLGDTLGPRLERHAGHGDDTAGRAKSGGPSAASSDGADGLEHAARDGRIERRPEPDRWRIAGERGNDFWAAAEWIDCSDGKARRAEPGIFPLAHGLPGGGVAIGGAVADAPQEIAGHIFSRVGVLRGAGNAIVPQVAAEFVKAAMEVMP